LTLALRPALVLGRGEATGELPAAGRQLGNRAGRDRILNIRDLDDRHEFTLMCKDFAQLGQFLKVDNNAFRVIKACSPGKHAAPS